MRRRSYYEDVVISHYYPILTLLNDADRQNSRLLTILLLTVSEIMVAGDGVEGVDLKSLSFSFFPELSINETFLVVNCIATVTCDSNKAGW